MLKQDIELKIKEALKAGDSVTLSTLRFLMASIKNLEIEKQHEITDEEVISVVQKQAKQHRESIEAYKGANRLELVDREGQELEILNKFLPQQLSEDEIRKIVGELISQLPESDKNNFGKAMGMAMGRLKGQVDGNVLQKIVKELLS